MKYLVLLALFASPASAADYAIILTEQERAAMVEMLDIATRAQGLMITRKTIPLWEKLINAPVVTDQKPADQSPKENKP